jgi:hypothetical protein
MTTASLAGRCGIFPMEFLPAQPAEMSMIVWRWRAGAPAFNPCFAIA